eukprot:6678114-Karenia_brevis.AAC.1
MNAAGATSAQLRIPPPYMRAGSLIRTEAKPSLITCGPKHLAMLVAIAASTHRAAARESCG